MSTMRLAGLCGAAVWLGGSGWAAELPMEVELVNTGFIYYYDLAVDPVGVVHAFMDETIIDKLYYSNNGGGAWAAPEFVDNTSDWGTINVSGAADGQGWAHVAYDTGPGGGGGNDILTYGTNVGGSWARSQLRSNSRWYAMDLNPDGEPRISYYYDYSGLNYAIMSDGSWSHEVVDSTGYVTAYAGRYSDLDVDANDDAHIVYYNYTTDAIRYATNRDGTWQWNEVVTGPSQQQARVAVHPSGQPLVAYVASGRIWLAHQESGAWVAEALTEAGSYGYLDTDVDGDGAAHVVYNDHGAGKHKLVIKDGDLLENYEIFQSKADGDGPRIALHGDIIHILVWKQSTNELFHLHGLRPLPGDLNCDGTVDAFDIQAFVLALTSAPDFEEYYQQYPDCDPMRADCNGDGVVDGFDIGPFVGLLTGS